MMYKNISKRRKCARESQRRRRKKPGVLQAERDYMRKLRIEYPEVFLKRELKKYGITPTAFRARLKAQHNKCALFAISKCDNGNFKRLVVDHKGDVFRGVLCDKHNRGLGFLGDSTEG